MQGRDRDGMGSVNWDSLLFLFMCRWLKLSGWWKLGCGEADLVEDDVGGI